MSVPQHSIEVGLSSGRTACCRMSVRVDLAERTGLLKTAIFTDPGRDRDLVAGKRNGVWSEIEAIDGRPAIEVAREVIEAAMAASKEVDGWQEDDSAFRM